MKGSAMPQYRVYAEVGGTIYLGTFDASNEVEAIQMGLAAELSDRFTPTREGVEIQGATAQLVKEAGETKTNSAFSLIFPPCKDGLHTLCVVESVHVRHSGELVRCSCPCHEDKGSLV